MRVQTTPRRSPRGWRPLLASAAVVLLTAACGGGGAGTGGGGAADSEFEPMTLNYTTFVGRDHAHTQAHEWWMNEVTERTGGAVTFESYYDAALCEGAETLSCVGDGRADIGFTTPIYNPAEFPLASINSLMFVSTNSTALGRAMNDLYRESPELRAEYAATNTRPLYFAHTNTPMLFMVEPLDSIESLRGRNIRAVGVVTNALQELGANPVATETSEMYEALQRGVLDGVVGVLDSVGRTVEVVNHVYDLGEYTGTYSGMHHVINQDVWDGLDPELQNVMNTVSQELVESSFDEFFLPADRQDCEALVAEVESIDRLEPAAQWQAWAERSGEGALEGWITQAENAGADNPRNVAEQFLALVAKYETEVSYTSIASRCRDVAQAS
jgi:TRAP-type transport system periplasmic protein